MEKARIFAASSGRALVQAETLRDELQTEFCEATLWSEEGRPQPGTVIVEAIENAAERFDFAFIILAKDDGRVQETADTLKAHDDRVIEAGLLMSVDEEDQCFVVSELAEDYLPSPLAPLDRIPFQETVVLSDPNARAKAIANVAMFSKIC
jgi:predicted nucleotide-binding protein